jgi:hypothetical protein
VTVNGKRERETSTMRAFALPLIFLASFLALGACHRQSAEPPPDMTALRQTVQEQTEKLYLIHLKLDSAAREIAEAEQRARAADCSDAEYVAAEAYRYLIQADDELIALGQELQALFNLDVEKANRR